MRSKNRRNGLKRDFSLTQRRCPTCNRWSWRTLGTFDANNPVADEKSKISYFELRSCSCETVYLSPLPTNDDFLAMYVDSSQFDAEQYGEGRTDLVLEFLSDRLRSIVGLTDLQGRPLRVLEIGAGKSWMCRTSKILWPNSLTVAQDITNEMVNKCPWVDEYYVAEIDDLELSIEFDIISLTHVFEHLPDPAKTLRFLRNFLAPNGTIFITMPYRPKGKIKTATRIDWEKFSYLHVPAHLQYLSENSMKKIASRVGLRVAFWDATSEGGDACEVHLQK